MAKESNPMPAPWKTVSQRLDKLARDVNLTSNQVRKTKDMARIFEGRDRISLAVLLEKMFPDKNRDTAQANFRKFKQRFNELMGERGVPLELASSQEKTAAENKFVWFEDKDPATAVMRRGNDQALEYINNLVVRGDLEQPGFVDRNLRIRRVPCLTFPGLVEEFGKKFFGGVWDGLSHEERHFYYSLGAKFEPIRQISPHPDSPRETVGFELLALDEAGRSFTSIERFVRHRNYDPAVHFAVMIYTGLVTIQYFRTVLPLLDDRIKPDSVFFTMNMAPYMVGHPRLIELFQEVQDLIPEGFMFEVSEKILSDSVDEVLRFQEAIGAKLALDDLDELDPGVRRALEPHVVMTKVGYKKTRPLLSKYQTAPRDVIAELRRFKLDRAPLVVEAMDEDLRQVFLYSNWDAEWGDLYIQGRDLSAGPCFERRLTALAEHGITGGGYIVAAEARRPLLRAVFAGCAAGLEITSHRRSGQALVVDFRALGGDTFSVAAPWGSAGPGTGELDPDTVAADYFVEALPLVTDGTPRPVVQGQSLCRFLVDRAQPDAGDDFRPILSVERPIGLMTSCDATDLLLRWAGVFSDTEDRSPQHLTTACALLGDTGSGKSALCRRLARHLLDTAQANPDAPLPLFLDLSRITTALHSAVRVQRVPRLEEIIFWCARDAGCAELEPGAVLALAAQGRVVVIMDGLEALLPHLTATRTVQFFHALHADAGGPAARLLMACRGHAFPSGALARECLWPDAQELLMAVLPTMNADQVGAVLGNTLSAPRAERVSAAFEANPDLASLAARPFLIPVLTRLLKRNPDGPRGDLALEAGVADAVLEHWLARDSQRHAMRRDVKTRCLEQLALRLLGEAGHVVHFEALYVWLRDWLRSEYGSPVSPRMAERVDGDLRACSLLVRDRRGFYSLAHPLLREHLAARAVVRGLCAGGHSGMESPRLTPERIERVAAVARRAPFSAAAARAAVDVLLKSDVPEQVQINALLLGNVL